MELLPERINLLLYFVLRVEFVYNILLYFILFVVPWEIFCILLLLFLLYDGLLDFWDIMYDE